VLSINGYGRRFQMADHLEPSARGGAQINDHISASYDVVPFLNFEQFERSS
jgi:hypothetical protein